MRTVPLLSGFFQIGYVSKDLLWGNGARLLKL
jgi:hypothetical protein